MTVCLKHVADIDRRDPVHDPAVSPAEGHFQAAAVERAGERTLVIEFSPRNGGR